MWTVWVRWAAIVPAGESDIGELFREEHDSDRDFDIKQDETGNKGWALVDVALFIIESKLNIYFINTLIIYNIPIIPLSRLSSDHLCVNWYP